MRHLFSEHLYAPRNGIGVTASLCKLVRSDRALLYQRRDASLLSHLGENLLLLVQDGELFPRAGNTSLERMDAAFEEPCDHASPS